MLTYPGRVGVQQRVLPAYRTLFLDRLSKACLGGLDVFAGEPRRGESILPTGPLASARLTRARNHHLLGGRAYLCYQVGLIEWLETCQPDLLVMEANPRYLSSFAGIRWMHRRRCRVIGWGLGAPSVAGRGWRRGLLERYLGGFDALIAYSQIGAEQYKALGFPAARVFVAPNAAAFAPLEMPKRPATDAGVACVLYVGRLVAQKRVDLLLRACGSLAPRPRLVIVGDGPERNRLEGLARQICPQAEFLGTQVGEALERCYQDADLFVLPGTGGLALQEAMSRGVALVSGRGDGTQVDMVTPANGWILEREDASALGDVLRQALADRARLHEMGEASWRRAREHFNVDAMVEAFVRAFLALSEAG